MHWTWRKMTMYSDFLEEIYSLDDVNDLVMEINLLLHEFGSLNEKKEIAKLSGKVRKSLLSKVTNSGVDNVFLKSLKKEALNLQEVKITFAKRPSLVLKVKVVEKIKENTGKRVVINSSVDSSLIGGIIISANGKYKDYSVKRKLYG